MLHRLRNALVLGIAAGFFALLLRSFLAARSVAPGKRTGQTPTPSPGEVETLPCALTPVSVRFSRNGSVSEIDLEEYIVGVVSAEMPASFSFEALRAQAVAARTYTVYRILHGGCRSTDADVCTGSGCCQAYADDAALHERWGKQYDENSARIRSAVESTAGKILTYDGEPIDALYHSASGGRTEDAGDVYAAAVPYLLSVESSAEAGTNRLTGEKRFTVKAFVKAVNKAFPKAKLREKGLSESIEILETTESGRVTSIRLGKTSVKGRELRAALNLDSALFTFRIENDEVIFSTRGFGHGVGMSQTGANVMGMGGRTYEEILTYYYTGVTVADITEDTLH